MTIKEWIEAQNPEALLANGFDDAIVGIVYRYGQWDPLVLYDRQKIIQMLIAQGLTVEEAEEHFSFNIIGAWVGDGTPAFAVFYNKDEDL